MAQLPKISIVVSTYNGRRWLPETLQSLLNQSYPAEKMEIVVIDDGSTDSSAELAKSILEKGQVSYLVKSTSNQRINRANNVGWKAASGDWVLFLGHDDLLAPEKLQLSFNSGVFYGPETAAVYSDWQRYSFISGRWDRSGRVIRAELPNLAPYPMIRGLFKGIYIHGSAIFFCRSRLDKIGGFDELINSAEDANIQIRIDMAGGVFRYVPSAFPLSFWRNTPGSWSKVGRYELAVGVIHNMKIIEGLMREKNLLNQEGIDWLASQYFSLGRNLSLGDWNEFLELANHLNKLKPNYIPPRASIAFIPYVIYRLMGYKALFVIGVTYRWLRGWIMNLMMRRA